jgi:hypothetical protein
MTLSCDTCKFFVRGKRTWTGTAFEWITTERLPKDAGAVILYGDCRRNAPIPASFEDGSEFPRVHPDDWCGQWIRSDKL